MDAALRQALEAILFVVDEPVDSSTLSQVLEVGRVEVERELAALAAELDAGGRGFVLREAAGGWRLYTAPAAAPYVERWVLAGRSGRLSQAALETLAVVAYKQPISRHEISDIRGVNADGAVRTLVARGLVEEVARDPGPGQAILYGTTRAFLEKLGLGSLDQLPPLTDFLDEGPAPDEPRPGQLQDARARLASGVDLPATGRPRGDPEVTGDDRDRVALPAPAPTGTSEHEAELDQLTDELERAARDAMARLDQALAAVEDATGGDGDGDDGDDRPGP